MAHPRRVNIFILLFDYNSLSACNIEVVTQAVSQIVSQLN